MKYYRSVDLKAIAWHAMEKYGFDAGFPKSVAREVSAMTEMKLQDGPVDISDLRSLLWSSIDNHDSMDLDQLEFCERDAGGEIKVKVAIADVDFYVPKESQTDRHAAFNGTSVYLGIENFPMLPDKLSKGITSLLPGRDRMAVVIEYSVLPDGSFQKGTIYRALVCNKAKLIYEKIGDWLEGTGPIPQTIREVPGLNEQIHLQSEAARLLKKFRMERGALDIDTLEAEAVVEGGSVKDIVIRKKNMARTIIEEFMVAANGTMVFFLGKAGMPMIQRVVRVPKYWNEIIMTAAAHGEKLPSEPDVKALAKFLDKQKAADLERFPDLSLTIVKLLGPGEYVTLEPGMPPTGHFSLAVSDYTHATAPNRRFVDIINQRLLKSILSGQPSPYTLDELNDLSAWLTDREKQSKKAERFMRKAAAAVLLQDRTGESFDALVTGASGKGTYVRLIMPPAEGRVVLGEKGLRIGQKIRVRLLKTDPYKGYIDFEHVGGMKH